MRDLRFQVCWKVDDSNSFKWTSANNIRYSTVTFGMSDGSLLDADTATDTQKFRDERNLVRRFHFDT